MATLLASPSPLKGQTFYFVLLMFFLGFHFVGVNPFSGEYSTSVNMEGEGNLLRQVVFVLILGLTLPLIYINGSAIKSSYINNGALLLLYGWFLLSPLWSLVPDISLRRVIGTWIILLTVINFASLPAERIWAALRYVTLGILVVNFVSVFVVPHLAITGDGFWQGMYDQKNATGMVTGLTVIAWFYEAYFKKNYWAWLVVLLGSVFLIFTYSKTSIVLTPVVIAAGLLILNLMKKSNKIIFLNSMILFGAFTTWLMIEFALALVKLYTGDLNFTGRTDVWLFTLDRIKESPWIGWGFGSFWAVGDLSQAVIHHDTFAAEFAQAHNGYIDIVASSGIVGLVLILFVILGPFAYLWRDESNRVSPHLYQPIITAYALLTFMILHNLTESSFGTGLHRVWLIGLFAIVTLHSLYKQNGKMQGGT